MKTKDQFKEALADVLWGEEIGKLLRSLKGRRRKEAEAYAELVKDACHGDRENIFRLPIVLLAHTMPCTMLWQSVLYRMIALDEKEDGDGESV